MDILVTAADGSTARQLPAELTDNEIRSRILAAGQEGHDVMSGEWAWVSGSANPAPAVALLPLGNEAATSGAALAHDGSDIVINVTGDALFLDHHLSGLTTGWLFEA